MSNQFTRLNLKSDDEWYTPKWPIEELVKNIKSNIKIWCPFDNENSNFVKVLKENKNIVYMSDKNENNNVKTINFLSNDANLFVKEYKPDYIISNPPFKGKCDIIAKCIELGIPYILLLGNSAFTQNGRMQKYLNNHKITFIEKPVEFFNKENQKKKFLCFWLESKKNV